MHVNYPSHGFYLTCRPVYRYLCRSSFITCTATALVCTQCLNWPQPCASASYLWFCIQLGGAIKCCSHTYISLSSPLIQDAQTNLTMQMSFSRASNCMFTKTKHVQQNQHCVCDYGCICTIALIISSSMLLHGTTVVCKDSCVAMK